MVCVRFLCAISSVEEGGFGGCCEVDTGGVFLYVCAHVCREFYSAQGPDANVFFVESRDGFSRKGAARL